MDARLIGGDAGGQIGQDHLLHEMAVQFLGKSWHLECPSGISTLKMQQESYYFVLERSNLRPATK